MMNSRGLKYVALVPPSLVATSSPRVLVLLAAVAVTRPLHGKPTRTHRRFQVGPANPNKKHGEMATKNTYVALCPPYRAGRFPRLHSGSDS